jgi:hypothetical protein
MIRPNPYATARPTIQPGMGYVSHMGGYHGGSLGYAPGARFSGLGQINTDSLGQQAIAAGLCTQADLNLLEQLGATDVDISNLLAGAETLAQIYANYGVTIEPSSTAAPASTATIIGYDSTTGQPIYATGAATSVPASAAVTAATPTISQPAPQIPSGSTILYTCTFNAATGLTTASSVVADISAQLAAHGMSMVSNAVQSSGLLSAASFTMTILDSVGNNLITDAKSILDSLVNQYTNNSLTSSSVTVVSPGTTAAGTQAVAATATTAAAAGTSLGAFLENNALAIGLGLGALILLNSMFGKKR